MTHQSQLDDIKADLSGAEMGLDEALKTIRRVAAMVEAMEEACLAQNSRWLLYPLPVRFPITSEFGDAPHPARPTIHEGIDLGCPAGVMVKAAASGRVVSAKANPAYGYRVRIEHTRNAETWWTWYCHLYQMAVVEGQAVIAGQVVGYSGTSGNVTGPHLHFNVQRESDQTLIAGLPEILRGCVNPREWVIFP